MALLNIILKSHFAKNAAQADSPITMKSTSMIKGPMRYKS